MNAIRRNSIYSSSTIHPGRVLFYMVTKANPAHKRMLKLQTTDVYERAQKKDRLSQVFSGAGVNMLRQVSVVPTLMS